MIEEALSPSADRQFRLFQRSLPLRMRLREILRLLGETEGLLCLDIGTDNGVISHYLRRSGGKWDTVVRDEPTAATVREVIPENVYVFEGEALPFKKKSFDAVVIVNALERIPADDQFIEECHKILKPDGRLVVSVANVKPWSPIRPLRRLLGLTYERKGLIRAGYTESDLFNILKHGFDLQGVRSYSRFFVELTDLTVQFVERRLRVKAPADEKRVMLLYSVARFFFWLAFQLDLLLVFNRGHYLVASAKRRAWRPRKAPVLVDGRSITEAVLSKASD
jgi:SAM-dependent methyltransferase